MGIPLFLRRVINVPSRLKGEIMNVDWTNPNTLDQVTRSNGSKNCPNCGAPIESERCPYCGSLFVDFACVSMDEPFYMKIKHCGNILIVKVAMTSMTMRSDAEPLYCDTIPLMINQRSELSMEFNVL